MYLGYEDHIECIVITCGRSSMYAKDSRDVRKSEDPRGNVGVKRDHVLRAICHARHKPFYRRYKPFSVPDFAAFPCTITSRTAKQAEQLK